MTAISISSKHPIKLWRFRLREAVFILDIITTQINICRHERKEKWYNTNHMDLSWLGQNIKKYSKIFTKKEKSRAARALEHQAVKNASNFLLNRLNSHILEIYLFPATQERSLAKVVNIHAIIWRRSRSKRICIFLFGMTFRRVRAA